jgi:hypothetical protein
MVQGTRGTGRKVGHLIGLVALAAILFAVVRDPGPLMILAGYGPLGMLAIVGWLPIVFLVVKALRNSPRGRG